MYVFADLTVANRFMQIAHYCDGKENWYKLQHARHDNSFVKNFWCNNHGMKSETLIIGGDSLRFCRRERRLHESLTGVIVIQPHVFKPSMDPLRSKKSTSVMHVKRTSSFVPDELRLEVLIEVFNELSLITCQFISNSKKLILITKINSIFFKSDIF